MTFQQTKQFRDLVDHFTAYAVSNKCIIRNGVPVRDTAAREMLAFAGPNYKFHSKADMIAVMKAANRRAKDKFYNWRDL